MYGDVCLVHYIHFSYTVTHTPQQPMIVTVQYYYSQGNQQWPAWLSYKTHKTTAKSISILHLANISIEITAELAYYKSPITY